MIDKDTQLLAEVYRKTVQKPSDDEDVDMFSPEFEAKERQHHLIVQKELFALQDRIANESDVFRRILQSEIKNVSTGDERYKATNNPKSKTRNALLTRHIYPNIKDWENNLLTSDFYKV
jgi:hypothetical protein